MEQDLLPNQLVINASETLCEEEYNYYTIRWYHRGESVQSQLIIICGNNTPPMWDDEIFLTINENEKIKLYLWKVE